MSKEENCYDMVEEITESDLNTAIKSINSMFTVVCFSVIFIVYIHGLTLLDKSSLQV